MTAQARLRTLTRDGVSLAFAETPGDGPPVLLVHGWCCDQSYLAPQADHFAALGRRVVAVDLRGHGASDKPVQPYPMEAFSDDLAWLCGELGLERSLVVGHSMGGIVGFDLSARRPDLVEALVMIDAAVALPAAARVAIPAFLEKLRGPDGAAALRAYVGAALFIPTDDPDRRDRILDAMAAAPRHVMVAAFEGLRDYDPATATARLRTPALYVAADEPTPRTDLARLRELAPDMLYGQTVGSGHFCQLEVPDQVDAMIERFLRVAVPR
ncbi:alpha/beta hydrolase [Chenggangzhangella methanolivorans]|uniref:Alpha/beta hydrolase n=1 Tax=Chenggangzhangella methanolivorans TaxID=1437009 RepID=A0A9E6RDY1_9HYPH|nr:alpha/beta hydrolase [Chenggangzhangella methanolivorans]QZN99360.1 alpha/beta hydrolase [Chenggangzhangella methanolivorans]